MTIVEAFHEVNDGIQSKEGIETLVKFFREHEGFVVHNNELYVLDDTLKMEDKYGRIGFWGWYKGG